MISVILGVKDRTDRLIECLSSWNRNYCREITEIVIVDWSSKVPIIYNNKILKQIEKANELNKTIVKVVRVEDQIYYNRCQALNLARSFTNPNNPILLKIDADYVSVNPNWIKNMHTIDGSGFMNYFVVASPLFVDSNYTGFLYVNKKHFDMVNGYNENLDAHWGYEDKDLELRLQKIQVEILDQFQKKSNLEKVIFYDIKNYIYHIPHDDNLRFQNMDKEIFNIYESENSLETLKKLSDKQKHISERQTSWKQKEYQILDKSKSYIRVVMK
jgi:hypothetical protein